MKEQRLLVSEFRPIHPVLKKFQKKLQFSIDKPSEVVYNTCRKAKMSWDDPLASLPFLIAIKKRKKKGCLKKCLLKFGF